MGAADDLSEKLLMKEDDSTNIPILASAPAPAPAPERGETYFRSFFVTLMVAIVAAALLPEVTQLKDSEGRGSAAVKMVQRLLPAFYYFDGATVVVAYLTVTVDCILPGLAFYLWILNIAALLFLVVFFVVATLFMDYHFFYVYGGIIALLFFTFASAVSEQRKQQQEQLQRSRRAAASV